MLINTLNSSINEMNLSSQNNVSKTNSSITGFTQNTNNGSISFVKPSSSFKIQNLQKKEIEKKEINDKLLDMNTLLPGNINNQNFSYLNSFNSSIHDIQNSQFPTQDFQFANVHSFQKNQYNYGQIPSNSNFQNSNTYR